MEAATFTAGVFTPRAPFTLPGDTFNIEILFVSAFKSCGAPPDSVFSQPDPNTYAVDFTDSGGGQGHYEVTVVSPTQIDGVMRVSSQDCSFTIPFTVTRTGD